jgi:hypothetical protein
MGSPFASQTQSDPIPLPFDPPHTVTVRKLTGRECDAAREAHATGLSGGGSRLWATKFRRILEGSISDKREVEQAIADPLTGYDRYALVRAGLVAWSYPQSITPLTPSEVVVALRKDAIEDLDDEAVDFIATEVLRLTKPGLFHATKEDADRAQKELSAAASPA